MITRVQTTEEFSQDIHNSHSIPKPPPHPAFPELPSIPKTFSTRSRIPPFQGLYRSEASPHFLRVLSTPRPSLFRRLQLQTWSSNNISFLISADSCATPSSLMFITRNASISADNYGQWQIFRHAITTSTSDHDRYNKYNMCRSGSFNSPQFHLHESIPVRYILSFFSKEKEVASLNPRAHTTWHWKFPCSSPYHHTSSSSC